MVAEARKVYKRLMEQNDTSVRKTFPSVAQKIDVLVHVSKISKLTSNQSERYNNKGTTSSFL